MGNQKSGKPKFGRKLDREGSGCAGYGQAWPKAWGIVGMASAVMAFTYAGGFVLPAQAAPATLRSPDATIYEQADEGSNALGSLVEGSALEYIGDVTAEDGSVWHQVTTAGGTAGYIKGDREIEVGEEAPAPEGEGGQGSPEGDQTAPENQGNPEEQAAPDPEGQGNPEGQVAPADEGGNGDAAPAGNGLENGEADTDGGEAGLENPEGGNREEEIEALEGADGEEPETSGDSQPEDGSPEDGAVMAGSYSVQNNQVKSYSLDSSGRIKGKENIVPVMNMGTGGIKERKAGGRIDLTVLLAVAVTFSGAGAMHLCWGRIKQARGGGGQRLDRNRDRLYTRRNEKKKHGQKRKGRKK